MRERARRTFADGARDAAEETERMLDAGMDTEAIAAAFGVQYKALSTRLRRNGYGVVLARLSRKRFAEATERLGRPIANGRYAA